MFIVEPNAASTRRPIWITGWVTFDLGGPSVDYALPVLNLYYGLAGQAGTFVPEPI